jgi:hypothetical protein
MNAVCASPKCHARAVHHHHVLYRQIIRRHHGDETDERNLIPLCFRCHERHHNRVAPLPLWALPDSVYEFAAELLGHGPAYEELRRRYRDGDPRLDALLGTAP